MYTILSNLKENLSLQPVLLTPFIIFLVFLYKLFFKGNHTTAINAPPSPRKLPILGHLHQLGAHPHRSLHSLSKRYGELMLIYLGYKPTLVVSSARVAKDILKTHDAMFSNRPKSSIFDKLLYNSRDVAAAPYGEYWRQIKSLCVLQLLSNKRVRSFRVIIEEETALMMEKIEQSTDSEVNLSEMLTQLTNNVVCRAALGRKYSEKLEGVIDFKEQLKEFAELLGTFNIGDFIPWLSWINKFSGFDQRLDKVAKTFDSLLEVILTEHLNRLNSKGNDIENENGDKAKDFVDVLLEVERENTAGFPIERDTIKALILDVFAAGTDTTYTVIEWAMTELLRDPKVMKKLQNEVRDITKGKQDITDDQLERMHYLKAVIKETLRLHPPIPLLVPRESINEVKLNGYDIAAKTMVIINAWGIQRDPAIWNEPEKFLPERFLGSPIDFKGHDYQLIPFGSGRRVCPGISFAMAINEFVLANLVNKFVWEFPAGVTRDTFDMSECTGLTMHRKVPLLAVATPYIQQNTGFGFENGLQEEWILAMQIVWANRGRNGLKE